MFDITYIVMLVAIGIGGGVVGSIIGVGGGIIFTPILTLMGLPPTQVASTSLVAVAFTSISSVTSYARQRRIKYAIASKLAVLSIPGAVLGAYLSTMISVDYFKLSFSILLIIAVGYILLSSRMKHSIAEKKTRLNPYPLLYCCAFAAWSSVKFIWSWWWNNFCSHITNIDAYENVRSSACLPIYYHDQCYNRVSYSYHAGSSSLRVCSFFG